METISIDGIEDKLTPISKKKTYNDWRLPTVKELLTLVNYSKDYPASDLKDTTSSSYWASSTYVHSTGLVWGVYFGNGYDYTYSKSDSYYVRCVRDGENGLEWSASSIERMSWDEAIQYAKNLEAPIYYKEN